MQHLARGAGIAHLGDLLAGLDPGTLVHQPGTIVAVGRQPLLVVLDDHQLPVADQSGARVHHHAIGRGPHGLAALAGDVDALPGGIPTGVAVEDLAIGRPAPGDAAAHRGWRRRLRRSLGGADGPARGAAAGAGRGGARALRPAARIQPQALAGIDRVGRGNAVPQRQVHRADAVIHREAIQVVAALDHDAGAGPGRRGVGRASRAHHLAAAGREQEQAQQRQQGCGGRSRSCRHLPFGPSVRRNGGGAAIIPQGA